MDFPPASPGGAAATGPRRRLLALSPRRGAQGAFHAPECYLNLLSAISCGIARERAAHASSCVDDSRAVGALGAFGLRREAAARRPPGRKGRARTARACRAGGTERNGHSFRRRRVSPGLAG